jgi:hypothetical protein
MEWIWSRAQIGDVGLVYEMNFVLELNISRSDLECCLLY